MAHDTPSTSLIAGVGLNFRTLGLMVLLGLVWFSVSLYRIRTMFRRFSKEHNIPLLPHSFLFGHIWIFAKASMKYKIPGDCAGFWQFHLMQKEYPEIAAAGVFYIDTWPMAYPMLVVHDLEMANQTLHVPKFWRAGTAHENFGPFTENQDLVTLEGSEWKQARAMFNPGFSASNLQSLAPLLLEEVLVFRDILRETATSGKVVKFEGLTIRLTVDMICRVVLNTRIHYQKQDVPWITTLLKQITLLNFSLRPLVQLDPTRPARQWLYRRQIRAELAPLIDEATRNHDRMEGPKTVLSQAISVYRKEQPDAAAKGLSPAFRDRLVNHIKMFMFAGHDTTGSTLAMIFYMLSVHPEQAAKVRAEHDAVLGADPAEAADRILADPVLMNKLPYTAAVVKEVLRLFPPVAGGSRDPPPGFAMVNPRTGKKYPGEGFMLHVSSSCFARDPHYWKDADTFMPERWLVADSGDAYHPVKGAWRIFEMGPRNCIGQELATLELRLVLALTIREFEVEAMYGEKSPTCFGVQAYPVDAESQITARVRKGLPAKVRARK